MIDRERTPANRLASGLIPTASIRVPSAVRRVSMAVTAKMAPAIRMENGTAEPVAAADELVRRGVVRVQDLLVGDDLGETAAGGHQHQRGHDGLDAENRDQETVPGPGDQRHQQRDADRGQHDLDRCPVAGAR